MKKKLLVSVLVVMLAASLLAGCGRKKKNDSTASSEGRTEEEYGAPEDGADIHVLTGYESEYYGVLNRFYDILTNEDYTDDMIWDFAGGIGVRECIDYSGGEPLNEIGYAFHDYNGDGVPELLVGCISDAQDGVCTVDEIFALYGLDENGPHPLFEGWARSAFYTTSDDRFYYSGSGGYLSYAFGVASVSDDGQEIYYDDFYFSDPDPDDPETARYYHNFGGYWNPDASDELLISEDEFYALPDELMVACEPIELTPFSAYTPTDDTYEIAVAGPILDPDYYGEVYISYADEMGYDPESCDYFTADNSDYQVDVEIFTDGYVENLRVLSLFLVDYDENGGMSFEVEDLYEQETLYYGRPLIVTMTFWGDSPSYGIAYTDSEGYERYYAIEVSGYDGSLLLTEF